MLPLRLGRRGLDEVHLLAAGVEPRSADPEVGAIAPLAQPEDVDVEAPRLLEVGDVDGDVMYPERLHGADSRPSRPVATRTGGGVRWLPGGVRWCAPMPVAGARHGRVGAVAVAVSGAGARTGRRRRTRGPGGRA